MTDRRRFEKLNDPSIPTSGRLDIPLLVEALKEGIAEIDDPSLGAIDDQQLYLRTLRDLVEEIELDEAIPKLDLLERGALNAVLQRLRFYQEEAQGRASSARTQAAELAQWRESLLRYTQFILAVEQLIRRAQ
jgi:hypothetical protein